MKLRVSLITVCDLKWPCDSCGEYVPTVTRYDQGALVVLLCPACNDSFTNGVLKHARDRA